MRKKTIKELHILMGLPGCGKTTFASELQKSHLVTVVDFDGVNNAGYPIESVLRQLILGSIVIFDGLFPTLDSVIMAYNSLQNIGLYTVTKVILDYWTPNKEICLWNDVGRREQNSKYTIEHLILPTLREVKSLSQCNSGINTLEIVVHTSVKKHKSAVLKDALQGIPAVSDCDNTSFCSTPWCLGGTSNNCYGHDYEMSAEEPIAFEAFDDLLLSICPCISYLQYKKVYDASVTYETKFVSDYYTNLEYGFWRCNLDKLYSALTKFGLI